MPQIRAWLHPVRMMHRKCKNPPHRPESSVRLSQTPRKGSPKASTAGGSRMMDCTVRSDDGYPGEPTASVISRSLRGCDERLESQGTTNPSILYQNFGEMSTRRHARTMCGHRSEIGRTGSAPQGIAAAAAPELLAVVAGAPTHQTPNGHDVLAECSHPTGYGQTRPRITPHGTD